MRHFSGELDGMRLLMADELEKVAGGDAEDGDDVPETELPEDDSLTKLPTVTVIAQAPPSAAVFNGLISLVTGMLGSLGANAITNAQQAESNLAKSFDPNDVVRNVTGLDADGNTTHGWQTKDGSTWWDNDRNNIPDQRLWRDPAGNVWSDWGNGPQLVRGSS